MHRHSSNRNSPEPECSRYASPFRGLLSPKKSKESVSSSISRKIKSPFRSKAILSPSKSIKKALMQIRGPRSRLKASLPVIETENMESSEPSTPNVMEFLIDVCPEDVLPKILAFAGPQKTATLSKVNRVWRDVITEEWTWRVLCEDLYKVCPCSFFFFFPFPINNGLSDQNESSSQSRCRFEECYCTSNLNSVLILHSSSPH
jgi:hypothetical protein